MPFKRFHQPTLLPVIVCSLYLIACGKKEQTETDLVTFPLRGEVVAIDTTHSRVTISHEEIPNYMMAMTMPFTVKNRALLNSIAVGDSVVGTLAVSRTESWLETLKVTRKGEKAETVPAGDIQLHRLFQAGDQFPDATLTNQDGKRIRISNFKGRVLALTFIYTRCPLPDFCIRMSNNFSKMQKALSKEKTMDGQWHLLSVSFDPKFDTPKVLKEYAKGYATDLSTWEFVTDTPSTIARLAGGLDLTIAEDEGLIQHNLRTVLLDKEGKLAKVIKGNDWNVDEITKEIIGLARR